MRGNFHLKYSCIGDKFCQRLCMRDSGVHGLGGVVITVRQCSKFLKLSTRYHCIAGRSGIIIFFK